MLVSGAPALGRAKDLGQARSRLHRAEASKQTSGCSLGTSGTRALPGSHVSCIKSPLPPCHLALDFHRNYPLNDLLPELGGVTDVRTQPSSRNPPSQNPESENSEIAKKTCSRRIRNRSFQNLRQINIDGPQIARRADRQTVGEADAVTQGFSIPPRISNASPLDVTQ